MGTINHNAIIATTWKETEVERIIKWINKLGDYEKGLFLISRKQINDYVTVTMIPDGSKEGWDDSNYGDDLRSQFVNELQKALYKDGSSPWDWIEVSFGEYGQKIVQGNCEATPPF